MSCASSAYVRIADSDARLAADRFALLLGMLLDRCAA